MIDLEVSIWLGTRTRWAHLTKVIAMPAVLDGCASCLKLTLTGSSEVMIDAGGYTISLRHESSVSAALAVH